MMTAFSQHNCKDSTTGGTSSSIRQYGCCKALRRALGRFLASRQIAKKNNGQTVVSNISTTTTETSAHNNNNSKLQVYLLLGQSNMYGMGRVGVVDDTTPGTLDYAVRRKGLYPYLLSSRNDWTTLWSAVRNVHVIAARDGKSLNAVRNEDLTIRNNTNIGPEVGIGHVLFGDAPGTNHNVLTTTNHNNNPVTQTLLLKSCIGNRSLGWDLLPPGSPSYEYNGQRYAAYGQSPAHWDVTDDNPTPTPGWYAGKQYDDDIHNARQVLKQLDVYVPNMPREAEVAIAGFFFWQGDKDRYDDGHAIMYERNLVQFIRQLRRDFDAPTAPFVLATLGQTDCNEANDNARNTNDRLIFNAMMAVDGTTGQYPDFVGNVSTVYAHPYAQGGSSNGHYNNNAEVYMDVGQAMGRAMLKLNKMA